MQGTVVDPRMRPDVRRASIRRQLEIAHRFLEDMHKTQPDEHDLHRWINAVEVVARPLVKELADREGTVLLNVPAAVRSMCLRPR